MQVVPGGEDTFVRASEAYARRSLCDGGVHRFDLLQSGEDSCNFVLFEVRSHGCCPRSLPCPLRELPAPPLHPALPL